MNKELYNLYLSRLEQIKKIKNLEEEIGDDLLTKDLKKAQSNIRKWINQSYKTLVRVPQKLDVLHDVRLIIHIEARRKILDDIQDNLMDFVSLGRSQDHIQIEDVKVIEIKPYRGPAEIDGHMYVTKDSVDEPHGTIFYVNKKYNIVNKKRVFEKIPCLWTSEFEAKRGIYIDAEGDYVSLN